MNHEKSKSKSGDTSKLPLLDEVNELIEKERLLLSLKLLAQKEEAVEWKSKYDKLVDSIGTKLSNPSIPINDRQDNVQYLTQLESLAAVESDPVEHISLHDINGLLKNRMLSWVLDLADNRIDKMLFGKLAKSVFGVNSSYSDIKIAIFDNCGVTDDFAAALLSMFRSAQLLAVDLSNNELSDSLFIQLIATLKERRVTPQYILLEGNTPFSRTVRNFESLLDALTDHTWGLTVSLEDFTNNAQIVTGSKAKKGAKRELNVDYKEIVKQPNRVFEFLKSFNDRLNPDNILSIAASKTKGMKKAIFGRMHALHRIAVLGLKHCLLSRRTVKLLADTLRYTAATLTDLDLSFSYIGYSGAEVREDDCSIIRLNIIGNAVGDQGIQVIGRSLVANKSLTFLDARSNSISSAGLRTLVDPLLVNCILVTLDLRGNSIDQKIALQLRKHLFNQGSKLTVHCSYEEDSFVESPPIRNTGSAIFDLPQKVRCTTPIGKLCKLYSIDLTSINLNYASKYGDPVALQWLLRPCSVGTSTVGKSTVHRTRQTKSSASSNHIDHVSLAAHFITSWEIKVSFNNQDLYSTRHTVEASSSLVSMSSMEDDSEWIPCSAVLTDLPLKGVIDIYVRCEEAPHRHERSKEKQFIAFEGIHLEMNHFPRKPFHVIGGDNASFNESLHGIVSKFETKLNLESHKALTSLIVLRRLRWIRDDSSATLSWRLKLTVYPQIKKITAGQQSLLQSAKRGNHDDSPPDAHALGYEWRVFVFTSFGLYNQADKGFCMGGGSTDGESHENVPLQPWQWTDFKVTLSGLRLNDQIILVAKPTSDRLDYPQIMLDRCVVEVRDFLLSEETGVEFPLPTTAPLPDCIHSCFHDGCSFHVPF